ncbi:lytic transglycosylase domain-containing protein [Rhizobium sp. CG4]|jgi:soluble lytic murein transglycosylase-like protein|uniref:lytic transglycosylase domain-containing protein n=1 Tax=Rhizobium sp. CG4 TaxID=2726075 RepID=UPI0020349AF1|nr:lytic transglycosylase domain-containing protein [Rhizobium sp. CG4]MCM2454101.1 lytic transglycosylase domain-containing protein [Rhizobium sp. CG4]
MTKRLSASRRTALLISTTFGIAATLAGCTSVEIASKPQLETTQPTLQAQATTAPAADGTAPAAATVVAGTEVAAQAAAAPATASVAVDAAGKLVLPPAAEIAAAAAQAPTDGQVEAQMVAQATTPAAEQATTAQATPAAAANTVATAGNTATFTQVAAVKGSFPSKQSESAAMRISMAMQPFDDGKAAQAAISAQTAVPSQKPQGVMMAYASAPQNSAIAAINTREGMETSPVGREKLSTLISKYSQMYDVPEDLVHRVVQRESRYVPSAFNRGHYGLMQIKHATARSMGFDGPASGLFDAETNLKYAVKYLRGAWLVADNDRDNAVRLYARGYYYDAKRKGMLHVLRK